MSSALREWLNLGLRWFHVFAGIMWVGQTYYFTWLDHKFTTLEKQAGANSPAPSIWMVHSGGFYTVDKQKSLGVPAEQVSWFRWEALMTWVAGVLLLILVYYVGDGLVDPDVAALSKPVAIIVGVSSLIIGWVIYDLAARSPLGKSQTAFAIFGALMTAAAAFALTHLFSGRGAYIHVGGIFGTIMTLNVRMRILPAQRRMIAAVAAGKPLDESLGAQAKLRSKHNTFLAVPVVLIMISSHYPVATYGGSYNWETLVALVLIGWGAAKLVRDH